MTGLLITYDRGNFGCDCNLSQFFYEAGRDDPNPERTCGYEAFEVVCVELPDGRRIDIIETSEG